MHKTRNPYEEDERVFQAAMSLAAMVAKSNKPLRLDLDLYMELVVPTKSNNHGQELMEKLDRLSLPDIMDVPDVLADDVQRDQLHRDLRGLLDAARSVSKDQDERHRAQGFFTEALADAFTAEDVCDVCQCLLVEEGLTEVSDGSGGWTMTNSWFVIPTPVDAINLF